MSKIQEEFRGFVESTHRKHLTEDKGTEFERSLERVIADAVKSTDRALRLCEQILGRGGANEYSPYDRLLYAHKMLEEAAQLIGTASELPLFADKPKPMSTYTSPRGGRMAPREIG